MRNTRLMNRISKVDSNFKQQSINFTTNDTTDQSSNKYTFEMLGTETNSSNSANLLTLINQLSIQNSFFDYFKYETKSSYLWTDSAADITK